MLMMTVQLENRNIFANRNSYRKVYGQVDRAISIAYTIHSITLSMLKLRHILQYITDNRDTLRTTYSQTTDGLSYFWLGNFGQFTEMNNRKLCKHKVKLKDLLYQVCHLISFESSISLVQNTQQWTDATTTAGSYFRHL